jgi:hypothetical protein
MHLIYNKDLKKYIDISEKMLRSFKFDNHPIGLLEQTMCEVKLFVY